MTVFKTSWRHIVRQKTSAFINVLGLTLGLCACIVIYLICRFDFSFDRFHPDGDRIFRVTEVIPQTPDRTVYINNIPPPAPALLRTRLTGLQELTAFIPLWTKTTIRQPANKSAEFDSHVPGSLMPGTILADPAYFDIFHYTWVAGGAAEEFRKPNRVVISEKRARTYFGDVDLQSLPGREIIYNDSIRVFITGIVKDWTENTDFPFTDFISYATTQDRFLSTDYNMSDWNGRSATCFVKLPAGLSPSQLDKPLSSFLKTFDVAEPNTRIRLELQPLSDIHFNGSFHGEDLRTAHKPTLYGLMGIAGLILLLAVVNFINLSSAQSLERMKETGIRKVLGSSKWKISLQFLTEAGLLTMLSTILAIALLPFIFRVFGAFIPDGMDTSVFAPGRILFVVIIMMLTAVSAGFYPARVLASYEPVLSLKGLSAKPNSGITLIRKAMIVFQFTISIAFIICALILHAQLTYIRNKDLGLNTEKVVMIETGGPRGQTGISLLDERIKKIPGVRETAKQILPPVGNATFGVLILGRNKNQEPMHVVVRGGNERFIPFYRIRLLAGRNIRRSDSLNELVINETFARAIGFEHPGDAIGQVLITGKDNFPELSGKTLPIVGVAADFNIFSLHEPIQSVIIAHIPLVEDKLAIRLEAGGSRATEHTLAGIQKAWKELYPDGNFEYRFLDESIAALYEKEERTSTLLTAAVSISIFISCIGLFGMMMYSVRTRTREISIRKVLGAPASGIVFLLNKENLRLISIALLIAAPVAGLAMGRWLESFVFRIYITPGYFLLAGIIVIMISMVTIGSLAVKAAMANPVKGLRSE